MKAIFCCFWAILAIYFAGCGEPPVPLIDTEANIEAGEYADGEAYLEVDEYADADAEVDAEVEIYQDIEGCEGCICYTNETCEENLICSDNICVFEELESGCEGCPCGVDEVCDEELLCGPDSLCDFGGPILDAASIGPGVIVEGPGRVECSQSSALMNIPWLSQKISGMGLRWADNMCCGPACITMVKGYVDNNNTLGDSDLRETIDWMDSNVSGWSSRNYNCSDTPSNDLVDVLDNYLELEAEAIETEWCNLIT